MLLVEENHVGASKNTQSNNRMLYKEPDLPRGHGGGGGSARNGGSQEEKERRHRGGANSSPEPVEYERIMAVFTLSLWTVLV